MPSFPTAAAVASRSARGASITLRLPVPRSFAATRLSAKKRGSRFRENCEGLLSLSPGRRPRELGRRRRLSSAASPLRDAGVTAVATAKPSNGIEASSGGAGEGISVAGNLFFSSLCVVTFGLGSWQTYRYFNKLDMVDARDADLKLPSIPFEEWQRERSHVATTDGRTAVNPASKESEEKRKSGRRSHRCVALRGTFLHDDEIIIGPRGPPPGALADTGPNSGRGGGLSSSTQGYMVITPLVVTAREDAGDALSKGGVSEDGAGKSFVSREKASPNDKSRGWFRGMLFRRAEPKSSEQESQCVPKQRKTVDETVVWVNRGWIPRQFAGSAAAGWERPEGTVEIIAAESKTETPGVFTPPSRIEGMESKFQRNEKYNQGGSGKYATANGPVAMSRKLLWFERGTMEELTNCKGRDPPLFVEIYDESGATGAGATTAQKYPAKPDKKDVGEFKVTPAVHAGYAFTWFSLSGAGVFMTKTLLSRGR